MTRDTRQDKDIRSWLSGDLTLCRTHQATTGYATSEIPAQVWGRCISTLSPADRVVCTNGHRRDAGFSSFRTLHGWLLLRSIIRLSWSLWMLRSVMNGEFKLTEEY